MTSDHAKPDVSIGEVHTSIEIADSAAPSAAQLRRLVKAMIHECLREERSLANSREQDLAMTDRAWRSEINRG